MQTVQRVFASVGQHAMVAAGVLAIAAFTAGGAAAQPHKDTHKAAPKAAAKVSKLDIMLMKPAAAGLKSGDNQFEVMVNGADGKPVSDADVSILFVMPAMPAMKMTEMRHE